MRDLTRTAPQWGPLGARTYALAGADAVVAFGPAGAMMAPTANIGDANGPSGMGAVWPTAIGWAPIRGARSGTCGVGGGVG